MKKYRILKMVCHYVGDWEETIYFKIQKRILFLPFWYDISRKFGDREFYESGMAEEHSELEIIIKYI